MRGLVKLSNFVAAASIVLLVYWVFIFILVEVFGLKVFRENLTQTFGLSVMGILALMAGSLMINVMFNMTRIANKQEGLEERQLGYSKHFGKIGIGLIVLFPLIAGALFGGDYLTSKKKESMLVSAARSVIEKSPARLDRMVNYEFDREWIDSTADLSELMARADRNYPAVSFLVRDTSGGTPVFLKFDRFNRRDQKPVGVDEKEAVLNKTDFVFATSAAEREYLDSVFQGGNTKYRFSASDGNYELFYPYFKGNRKIVIYFADQQRYGKFGS